MKKIEEVEALCAKVVNQFSQTWEALIDDKELEKFVEDMHRAETEAAQLKNEMKNLTLA